MSEKSPSKSFPMNPDAPTFVPLFMVEDVTTIKQHVKISKTNLKAEPQWRVQSRRRQSNCNRSHQSSANNKMNHPTNNRRLMPQRQYRLPIRMPRSSNSVDAVYKSVEDGLKVIVLMRGLPGSGKSTLAKKLVGDGVILSTDEYFDRDEKYVYSVEQLEEAHRWNFQRAIQYMENDVSPLIVDNTNCKLWEMERYVKAAIKHRYDEIDFIEPDTEWKFNPAELAKRNRHKVPEEKIRRMLDTYHRNVTLKSFRLQEMFYRSQPRPLKKAPAGKPKSKTAVESGTELQMDKSINDDVLQPDPTAAGKVDDADNDIIEDNAIQTNWDSDDSDSDFWCDTNAAEEAEEEDQFDIPDRGNDECQPAKLMSDPLQGHDGETEQTDSGVANCEDLMEHAMPRRSPKKSKRKMAAGKEGIDNIEQTAVGEAGSGDIEKIAASAPLVSPCYWSDNDAASNDENDGKETSPANDFQRSDRMEENNEEDVDAGNVNGKTMVEKNKALLTVSSLGLVEGAVSEPASPTARNQRRTRRRKQEQRERQSLIPQTLKQAKNWKEIPQTSSVLPISHTALARTSSSEPDLFHCETSTAERDPKPIYINVSSTGCNTSPILLYIAEQYQSEELSMEEVEASAKYFNGLNVDPGEKYIPTEDVVVKKVYSARSNSGQKHCSVQADSTYEISCGGLNVAFTDADSWLSTMMPDMTINEMNEVFHTSPQFAIDFLVDGQATFSENNSGEAASSHYDIASGIAVGMTSTVAVLQEESSSVGNKVRDRYLSERSYDVMSEGDGSGAATDSVSSPNLSSTQSLQFDGASYRASPGSGDVATGITQNDMKLSALPGFEADTAATHQDNLLNSDQRSTTTTSSSSIIVLSSSPNGSGLPDGDITEETKSNSFASYPAISNNTIFNASELQEIEDQGPISPNPAVDLASDHLAQNGEVENKNTTVGNQLMSGFKPSSLTPNSVMKNEPPVVLDMDIRFYEQLAERFCNGNIADKSGLVWNNESPTNQDTSRVQVRIPHKIAFDLFQAINDGIDNNQHTLSSPRCENEHPSPTITEETKQENKPSGSAQGACAATTTNFDSAQDVKDWWKAATALTDHQLSAAEKENNPGVQSPSGEGRQTQFVSFNGQFEVPIFLSRSKKKTSKRSSSDKAIYNPKTNANQDHHSNYNLSLDDELENQLLLESIADERRKQRDDDEALAIALQEQERYDSTKEHSGMKPMDAIFKQNATWNKPQDNGMGQSNAASFANHSQTAPSLRAVMEEEMMANKASRNRVAMSPASKMNQTGPPQSTMAPDSNTDALKRHKLYQLFSAALPLPDLDYYFEAHQKHLDNTISTICEVHGLDATIVREIDKPYVLSMNNARSVSDAMFTLDNSQDETPGPKYVTYASAEAAKAAFDQHREQANGFAQKRFEANNKSKHYIQKGQPNIAVYYSLEASKFSKEETELNLQASAALEACQELGQDSATTLDLHYFRLNEALALLAKRLQKDQARLVNGGHLDIITGRGNNSRHGKPKLYPQVKNFLSKRSNYYRFQELNSGGFRVWHTGLVIDHPNG